MTGGAIVRSIVRRKPSAIGINTMALCGMRAIGALAQVAIPQTCIAIAATKGKPRLKGSRLEKVQFPVTTVAGCHGDLLFCFLNYSLCIILLVNG